MVFARDLLGKVIITAAPNPYSLPPDFGKLPPKFKWPAYTGHYKLTNEYNCSQIKHVRSRCVIHTIQLTP